ncbi:MAG: DUF2336 domain-containing protein [Rhodospirillales bacterium]|nr:DUF2336 domain-containing protein [Rhodospirillales bacterium]
MTAAPAPAEQAPPPGVPSPGIQGPASLPVLGAISRLVPPDESARVRLGAGKATQVGVLLALARDEAVTVRASVALNQAAPPAANALLARDLDERVRTLVARKLALLLPGMAASGRARIGEHVIDVLEGLVSDEAVRVRAAIADVVKEMATAPRALILRLAADTALPVAEPVLRLSPILTQADLLALLAAPPCPATAVAIARRPGLPEVVADRIAAMADSAAVEALLANPTAAIREATLDALIAEAADHPSWHGPLVRRPRLTARAAAALSEIVATVLLEELSARADLDPAITADLRHRLAARLMPPPVASASPAADALAEARHLAARSRLDEGAVLDAVRRGETRLATALLAVAASVEMTVVERAASLRSGKGLVSLVWKAGFTMRLAGPLQTLLARLAPEAVLRAAPGGDFPLSSEEMRWQIEFLSVSGR